MTNEKKHYVLRAEPGNYRVIGGSTNPVANTAIIAIESLVSPGDKSVILPHKAPEAEPTPKPDQTGKRHRTTDAAHDFSKDSGAIVLSPKFKWAFVAVLAITVLSGIAQIVMAALWEHPTGLQQEVFSAMGFAWKIGFGAIVGLLGGKTL